MAHAQIIIAVDRPTEVAEFDAWLAANESRLTYVSENTGCGCCVDIYDVDGPEVVLRSIPPTLSIHPKTASGAAFSSRQA